MDGFRRECSAIARRAVALCASLLTVLSGACTGDAYELVTPPPGTAPPERLALAPTYRASGHGAAGDVFVHLFEWRWDDIAHECTTVLGPAGISAVQVSPPQEHLVLAGAPWWQRYQPVSYSVGRSRSGDSAAFVSMVTQCRTAGVDIYVDAVLNHMTAGAGTGSAGTVYSKYEYPGLYTAADFRTPCDVTNYQSVVNVQDCELLGLADLRTDKPSVQQSLANYLIALHRLGVAGFRLDAAKHIQPVELDAIVALLHASAVTEGRPKPYLFSEVIDYGGDAVKVGDYFGLGWSSGGASDITEFKYRGIGDKVLPRGTQKLADLTQFSASNWGLMPSDKAVVFVENHDTQRSDGISYRDGQALVLSYVWMLGQPYGYPKIMSSYAFDRNTQAGRDRGPPSDAGGATMRVACASRLMDAVIGEWVCEHRDATIVAMVAFRRAVAGTDVRQQWDNGGNAVAFSRGARGFVAINRESVGVTATVPSGLPGGTYCDLLTGGRRGDQCAGRTVVVGDDGVVPVQLEANRALVLQIDSRR